MIELSQGHKALRRVTRKDGAKAALAKRVVEAFAVTYETAKSTVSRHLAGRMPTHRYQQLYKHVFELPFESWGRVR